MFKYRPGTVFSQLKVLLLMHSDSSSRRTDPGTDPEQSRMRGFAIAGCGWPQMSCSHRDDDEEYYGPRPRSLAPEDKEGDKPQGAGGLEASSLPSLSESGVQAQQCRICFQGPEKGELLSPCRCDGSVRCTHQSCLIRWISERGSWSCELCYFKYQVLAISTKNPLQSFEAMEEIYVNMEPVEQSASHPTGFCSGSSSSSKERLCLGVAVSLGILNVFLLTELIALSVHTHDMTADFSDISNILTEQNSNKFPSVNANFTDNFTDNFTEWQAISLTVIERVQIAAIVLGSLFLFASISWLVWSSLSPSAKWQRQDLLFQICYSMYGFMDVVCVGLIIHEGSSVYRIFKRWRAVNQQWKVLNYEKTKDLGDSISSSSKTAGQVERNFSNGIAADGRRTSRHVRAILTHHCGYTILHILSQLRPSNLHGANQEVVMRVTTV